MSPEEQGQHQINAELRVISEWQEDEAQSSLPG